MGSAPANSNIADEEEFVIFASLRDALSSRPFCLKQFSTPIGTRAALKSLSSYTSRHERAFQRALKELKALQNERAVRTNFADENVAEPSPLCRNRARSPFAIGGDYGPNRQRCASQIRPIRPLLR